MTAWQALFEHAGVQGFDDSDFKGKRVLIIAAAGSVGIWLVQLAKMAGLEIVAQVGSPENEKLLKGLGAAEVIDYKKVGLKEWASAHGPVDMVFDLLGGKTLEDAWYCVKGEGALISIVEPPGGRNPKELKGRTVKNEFFIIEPNSKQLAELSRLANDGRCKTIVDSVWNFEYYEEAFARMNEGKTRGKVVIQIEN